MNNAHPDTRRFVVVGASLAGLRAVEAARKAGFEGAITLIGAESHLPMTGHRCPKRSSIRARTRPNPKSRGSGRKRCSLTT